MKKSRAYHVWQSMRARCLRSTATSYHRYGGRGISICKRWDTFSIFLKDMGEPPVGLTLDRIDNDGDYKPSNCRWATHKEQQRNSSNCRVLSFRGVRKGLSEWAISLGITQSALTRRLNRHKWPLARALTLRNQHP